jgi:hypothetical protein
MKHKTTKPVDAQSRKFIEAARELGCDEDESAFDEMVKKVAKAPPPRQEPQNANASRSKPKK